MENLFGKSKSKNGQHQDADHWMGVSDLMAGLMMVFLFIAIAFMRYMLVEQDRIKEIAVSYQDNQVAIYEALVDEFDEDLKNWDAVIDKQSLAFEFLSPDVLFSQGQTLLTPTFQEILDDFFPRYLTILTNFTDSIDEVRIEGHTSSDWSQVATDTEAYFLNMGLSQGRTRSVLNYVYQTLPTNSIEQAWVKNYVAAVGYSSSRLTLNPDGSENPEASRRVAFKVMSNAETQIRKILED